MASIPPSFGPSGSSGTPPLPPLPDAAPASVPQTSIFAQDVPAPESMTGMLQDPLSLDPMGWGGGVTSLPVQLSPLSPSNQTMVALMLGSEPPAMSLPVPISLPAPEDLQYSTAAVVPAPTAALSPQRLASLRHATQRSYSFSGGETLPCAGQLLPPPLTSAESMRDLRHSSEADRDAFVRNPNPMIPLAAAGRLPSLHSSIPYGLNEAGQGWSHNNAAGGGARGRVAVTAGSKGSTPLRPSPQQLATGSPAGLQGVPSSSRPPAGSPVPPAAAAAGLLRQESAAEAGHGSTSGHQDLLGGAEAAGGGLRDELAAGSATRERFPAGMPPIPDWLRQFGQQPPGCMHTSLPLTHGDGDATAGVQFELHHAESATAGVADDSVPHHMPPHTRLSDCGVQTSSGFPPPSPWHASLGPAVVPLPQVSAAAAAAAAAHEATPGSWHQAGSEQQAGGGRPWQEQAGDDAAADGPDADMECEDDDAATGSQLTGDHHQQHQQQQQGIGPQAGPSGAGGGPPPAVAVPGEAPLRQQHPRAGPSAATGPPPHHTATMDIPGAARGGWELSPTEGEAAAGASPWDEGTMSSESDPLKYMRSLMPSRRYCCNCTGPLLGANDRCRSCGHHAALDQQLLDGRLLSAAAPGRLTQHLGSSAPLLAYDERLLEHSASEPRSHPERPERAATCMARLAAAGLVARCYQVPCRPATFQELAAVHDPALILEVQQACQGLADQPEGVGDGHAAGCRRVLDCYMKSSTYQCAALAAGAAADVAAAVAQGQAPAGAAIIRPPGHHAEGGLAMGFCFFNNAAVAARAAQRVGAQRVIILDWDVHHGNGTQQIFETDPGVMYMSLHRYDGGEFFPGTGPVHDVGVDAGTGYNINIPWDAGGVGDADYIAAFTRVLLPIAYEFNPDLIIVSAGFDAADGDPLGGCHVSPACFGHMTALLQPVAPVVLLLEGGYNLAVTAASVEACVRVLLGEAPQRLKGPLVPTRVGLAAIAEAQAVHSRHWRCLQTREPHPTTLQPLHRPTPASPNVSYSPWEGGLRGATPPPGGGRAATPGVQLPPLPAAAVGLGPGITTGPIHPGGSGQPQPAGALADADEAGHVMADVHDV